MKIVVVNNKGVYAPAKGMEEDALETYKPDVVVVSGPPDEYVTALANYGVDFVVEQPLGEDAQRTAEIEGVEVFVVGGRDG